MGMSRKILNVIKKSMSAREIKPLYYTNELREAYLGTSVSGGTLFGKTVMVTGATGGIGAAISLRFLFEGCHVIISGRNQNRLNDLKDILLGFRPNSSVDTLMMDLQYVKSVDSAINEIEQKGIAINILVNNAGVFTDVDKSRRFRTVRSDEFNEVWNTNFEGMVILTEKLLPLMCCETGGKTVINIFSICANYKSFQYTPYGISKSAILKWTELMQINHPDIKFTTVQPGSVATMMGNLKLGDNIANHCNVLHHPALPEEIAALVAFLASDVGRFISNTRNSVIASACEVL